MPSISAWSAASLESRSGAKPPSSPTGGPEAPVVEGLLQRVEDLGARPQPLGEGRRAVRDDHELLEVDLVVGVGAAVEHVHHRHRQDPRLLAAEMAPERLPGVGRGGLRDGERDAEDGVRAEPRLVRRAVELDHRVVEAGLVGRVAAVDRGGDLAVDVGDGVRHALAAEGAAAVAQLDRLELAGRRARGHGGPARARPESSVTSTSTVGLPRLSMICRPWTSAIALTCLPLPPRSLP